MFGHIFSIVSLSIISYIVTYCYIPPIKIPIFFYLFPQTSFVKMLNILAIECYYDRCVQSVTDMPSEIKYNLVILFGVSTVYGIIGLLLDLRLFSNTKKDVRVKDVYMKMNQEDKQRFDDTKEIIEGGQQSKYALVVHNIHKTYRLENQENVEALKGVSFKINKGEIFGLLGPNGAGKTTLLSILTGDNKESKGEAYINGLSVSKDIKSICKIIGVCPQFDCLWPELTVEEHFLYYIRIRGILSKHEQQHVDIVVEQMNLEEHRHKRIEDLSGGMKRRVSIGIAIAGDVKLVFLDEPTSGLDPINRIQIWHILSKLRHTKSILLTTHLMEEADQLCDRIGVINLGEIVCLDFQTNLKNAYGNGFTLSVVLNQNSNTNIERLIQLVSSVGPTSIANSEKNMITLNLNCNKKSLISLFAHLENRKTELGIYSWSFSQCSLKDVFMNAVEKSAKK